MKAFPQKYPQDPSRPWSQLANPVDSGMDLRDYFAGLAMQSDIASQRKGMDMQYASIAKRSYEMADAMMKARNDS